MDKFIATLNDQGRTILKFLEKTLDGVPKSRIERLFRSKDVKINGKRINDKKTIINEGDEIVVYGVRFAFVERERVKHTFKVIFEDDNILVVEKPEGVVVHGEKESLDNQVLSYLKFEKQDSFTPSHIGRIDKGTSGIMLYGKNYQAVRMLNDATDHFDKYYIAISSLEEDQELKAMIFHDEENQKEAISEKFGKDCHTIFKVLGNSKVEAKIITGRKHQIRASLEFLGHPIKGDWKYDGTKAGRVYLHSHKLVLNGLEGELAYLNGKVLISKVPF